MSSESICLVSCPNWQNPETEIKVAFKKLFFQSRVICINASLLILLRHQNVARTIHWINEWVTNSVIFLRRSFLSKEISGCRKGGEKRHIMIKLNIFSKVTHSFQVHITTHHKMLDKNTFFVLFQFDKWGHTFYIPATSLFTRSVVRHQFNSTMLSIHLGLPIALTLHSFKNTQLQKDSVTVYK